VWATYRFGKDAASKVVVGRAPNAALVEQYRRLGAALHHHQLQGGAHTLMVTSAVASEGKTLTATNLALTLSHSYKARVLLIDADLRRPSIHQVLMLPNSFGLSDILRRDHPIAARFQEVSPLLSVLTAGRPDSDPMAGLVSDTMARILTEAATQFDWVIVDTPPVALLPDANLLAAMIDTALLVVGANATPYPLVARAVEAIGEQRILGVVLNRMAEAELIGSYNYYGYGGHSYGGRAKPSSIRRWLPFLHSKKPKASLDDVRE
jgi:capsular exopolysaccharide synthesis family protein